MFDIAPTELLLCAVIALVVIGPKDLPNALRFVGRWVGKARRMAGTFRTGIDTMMREAELKEMEDKWRAHNDAIMQAHPQIGMDYPTPEFGAPPAATPTTASAAPSSPAPSPPAAATPPTPPSAATPPTPPSAATPPTPQPGIAEP
jgi:sec-independent protein translocase protein TatB